jgi:hypothetical protein
MLILGWILRGLKKSLIIHPSSFSKKPCFRDVTRSSKQTAVPKKRLQRAAALHLRRQILDRDINI